jgi:thiaminase/transcriptional activator TenA
MERVFQKDSLVAELRERCSGWAKFTEHEFVRQMQSGSLPRDAYRSFLVQDYLFLRQLSRVWCLLGTKADSLDDVEAAASNALGTARNEAKALHVQQCKRWNIELDELEHATEQSETIAYTRFLLDCGNSGDALDVLVALAPCALGYAEIGLQLASSEQTASTYKEWIDIYSGEEFVSSAESVAKQIEEQKRRRVCSGSIEGTERMRNLQSLFDKATKLETNFWSMALRASDAA